MVVIAAVAVFGIDGGGLEQTDLIVPHQSFFIDSVHGGELAYGEQPAFLSIMICLLLCFLLKNFPCDFLYDCLDRTVTVRSMMPDTGRKYKMIGG